MREAQAARQGLQAAGQNTGEIDDFLRQLRGLQGEGVFANPRATEQLMLAALDTLKKAEFNLRKKLDVGNDSLALSGSDEVPANFRDAIAAYFRSIGSLSQRQTPQAQPATPAQPAR